MENEQKKVVNTSGTTCGREMTFGEKAVGLTFNPSNDPKVQNIKVLCAAVIDELNKLREEQKECENDGGNSERIRMYSVAITELQTAQMWGVKAATWKV